jgi:hypothetical protein
LVYPVFTDDVRIANNNWGGTGSGAMQAKGVGYAMSTDTELQTIKVWQEIGGRFNAQHGVVLCMAVKDKCGNTYHHAYTATDWRETIAAPTECYCVFCYDK